MERDEILIKWLEIESERLRFHGTKSWDEIKHFSWALSILLAASFIMQYVYNIKDTRLLIVPPIIAVGVSLIAIFTIFKESMHSNEAFGTVLKIEKYLGFYENGIVSEKRKNRLYKNNNLLSTDEFVETNLLTKTSIHTYSIVYLCLFLGVGIYEIFWLSFTVGIFISIILELGLVILLYCDI